MNKPDKELDEHDLKSIEDWITYYRNLCKKKGGEKYIVKFREFIWKLESMKKIVKNNFIEAVADIAARRMAEDMRQQLLTGDIFMEATEEGLKIISSQKTHDDFLEQLKKEKKDGSK